MLNGNLIYGLTLTDEARDFLDGQNDLSYEEEEQLQQQVEKLFTFLENSRVCYPICYCGLLLLTFPVGEESNIDPNKLILTAEQLTIANEQIAQLPEILRPLLNPLSFYLLWSTDDT